MALIKRGNIWHVRVQVAGVMIAKSTKTANKRLAEQLEAKWINQIHSEVVVAGRRPVTVEKAIGAFLESRRGTAGYGSAEVKLRVFVALHDRMLHAIKADEVRALALNLVENEGYSINTINVKNITFSIG